MFPITLEEILIVVIALLSTVITLKILSNQWNKLSKFFHSHPAYFTLAFSVIYSVEQAVFIIISGVVYNGDGFTLSGLFALVVLTTVTIQGIAMESRNKKLLDENQKKDIKYNEKVSEMEKEYEILSDKLTTKISDLQEENEFLFNEYYLKSKRKNKSKK